MLVQLQGAAARCFGLGCWCRWLPTNLSLLPAVYAAGLNAAMGSPGLDTLGTQNIPLDSDP